MIPLTKTVAVQFLSGIRRTEQIIRDACTCNDYNFQQSFFVVLQLQNQTDVAKGWNTDFICGVSNFTALSVKTGNTLTSFILLKLVEGDLGTSAPWWQCGSLSCCWQSYGLCFMFLSCLNEPSMAA